MDDTPEKLLQYFEAIKLTSNNPEYVLGAWLTAEWIALMRQETISEQEFRHLFNKIEAPVQTPGSGWFELWLRVRHWAYGKGFAVPDHHRWGWNPDAFTCRETGDYAGQM